MRRKKSLRHTYRLQSGEAGNWEPPAIEFEAASPDAALRIIHRLGEGEPVELFEDGRRLAALQLSSGGFWVVA